LIFLDEPTSGMDSIMALKMVEIMANLAKKGATVIAVVHQPSSLMFQLFDQLMLLAMGQIIYFVGF
jgi:ABC-type multidrug transport system ATPase subunit